MNFLSKTGLQYFWNKIKSKFLSVHGGSLYGNLNMLGNIIENEDGMHSIGTSSKKFLNVYTKNLYADNVITQKNITTGKEFETNVFVDGKRVFGKRINCGQLPNSGQGNTISTGLTNVTYVGLVGGFNPDNSQFIPCNIYFNSNLTVGAFIQNNAIRINNNESGTRSGIVYVTVYYTKN